MKRLVPTLIIMVVAIGISLAGDYTPSSREDMDNSGEGKRAQGVLKAGIVAADLALGTNSLGVTLPDNTIIKGGYIDISTGLSGTGVLSTVALEINGSADLLTAVTVTNASGFGTAGIKAIIPVGTAATSVKTTAERTLNIVVGVEAMNAGVGTVVLEYDVMAD